MTLDAALLARVERLRGAVPPPECCADDIDAEMQVDLALALLDVAKEARREAS